MEKAEFRMSIKHCLLMTKLPFKLSDGLKNVILSLLRRKQPFVADFKSECTDTNDAECCGHPNEAVTPENKTKTLKIAMENRYVR